MKSSSNPGYYLYLEIVRDVYMGSECDVWGPYKNRKGAEAALTNVIMYPNYYKAGTILRVR